jgi:hypothetical protein
LGKAIDTMKDDMVIVQWTATVSPPAMTYWIS